MSASLGGLIKDYRLQKNIPQLEVAYKVGWKDATILSRIEQGVTKVPTRQIVDKICLALELDEPDKNLILLAGGYVPTAEEIKYIKRKIDPIINESKYPINVADFAWRMIHENKAAKEVHYKNIIDERYFTERNVNILELIFDERYLQNKQIMESSDKDILLTQIIAQFISENKGRSTHKWYTNIIKGLMENDVFRKTYQRALNYPKEELILDFSVQRVIHRDNPHIFLNFYLFNVPLMFDRRIYLEYLIPADVETFKFYEKRS
jgi:transcriptional regulator with XRE-family HTH domain